MMLSIKNELLLFIKGYLKGEYPDYLFKAKLAEDIPVFNYHHVDSSEFEAHLFYLKQNGYQTLTADELEQAQWNRKVAPERSVVLTFDDGLSDLYRVAYPLLKKYQQRAVVFLIPNWVDRTGLVTWNQIKEMHRSGLIDFQSHSMNHPAIFISSKIVGFYNPELLGVKPWNIPLTHTDNGSDNTRPPIWGTPIYEHASRFSDEKRCYPDAKIQQVCQAFIEQQGKEKFFEQKNWQGLLFAQVNNYRARHAENIKYETPNEQMAHILKEILESKRTIETKLPPKTVSHFAAPWHQIGELTLKLLAEAGYRMAFMGIARTTLQRKNKNQVAWIRRVSGDFIECLPGKGRRFFWSVMLSKMMRRFKKGSMY